MTDPDATLRYLYTTLMSVRRQVAARLDLAGHPECADRIRHFSTPELVTLADLEAATQ